MVGNNSDFSDQESMIYDRQIRLWGLESQKRLRNANILLIGMKGLGTEICKNIVLAGVKSITILDSDVVTEEDPHSQFLTSKDVGKNRAVASINRTKQLNPMVEVTPDVEDLAGKPDSFFYDFQLICATRCPMDQLLRMNQICREKNIKFFCGDVFGFFGCSFSDLQIHDYVEDVTVHSITDIISPSKKKKVEAQVVTKKATATFVPLQDVLDVDLTGEAYANRRHKIDPLFFLMQVLMKFRTEVGRDPWDKDYEQDVEVLQRIRDELLPKFGVTPDKLPETLFSCVFGEVSPVNAIIGGFMAQEIIKIVSKKGVPFNNIFLYNPITNVGTVETIGY